MTDPAFDEYTDKIGLLYRFPDGKPALSFKYLFGDVYAITYVAPSLEDLWLKEIG